MTARASSAKRRAVTASVLLDTIAADLFQIKTEDGLTWPEVGQVLGRGDDMAARYANATAEMPITAYLFGKRVWGTRLCGRVEAMVDADRQRCEDAAVMPSVLDCARGLAEALRDGRICSKDIHENRAEIEDAISALEGLLLKLDGGK